MGGYGRRSCHPGRQRHCAVPAAMGGHFLWRLVPLIADQPAPAQFTAASPWRGGLSPWRLRVSRARPCAAGPSCSPWCRHVHEHSTQGAAPCSTMPQGQSVLPGPLSQALLQFAQGILLLNSLRRRCRQLARLHRLQSHYLRHRRCRMTRHSVLVGLPPDDTRLPQVLPSFLSTFTCRANSTAMLRRTHCYISDSTLSAC